MGKLKLKQLNASGASTGQIAKYDGSNWVAGGKTFTSVQTGTYTAAADEVVRYNASGGTFQINMPSSPVSGQEVEIEEDVGDATNVTVSGNGNNIQDPAAPTLAASVSAGGAYANFRWRFNGSVWRSI